MEADACIINEVDASRAVAPAEAGREGIDLTEVNQPTIVDFQLDYVHHDHTGSGFALKFYVSLGSGMIGSTFFKLGAYRLNLTQYSDTFLKLDFDSKNIITGDARNSCFIDFSRNYGDGSVNDDVVTQDEYSCDDHTPPINSVADPILPINSNDDRTQSINSNDDHTPPINSNGGSDWIQLIGMKMITSLRKKRSSTEDRSWTLIGLSYVHELGKEGNVTVYINGKLAKYIKLHKYTYIRHDLNSLTMSLTGKKFSCVEFDEDGYGKDRTFLEDVNLNDCSKYNHHTT